MTPIYYSQSKCETTYLNVRNLDRNGPRVSVFMFKILLNPLEIVEHGSSKSGIIFKNVTFTLPTSAIQLSLSLLLPFRVVTEGAFCSNIHEIHSYLSNATYFSLKQSFHLMAKVDYINNNKKKNELIIYIVSQESVQESRKGHIKLFENIIHKT